MPVVTPNNIASNDEGHMSKKSNQKKSAQLGMPHGTATARLKKSLLFQMAQELGRDECFQCGELIEDIDNLSIEHKEPWLDSPDPVALFFDLNNIAFSHLKCNIGSARQTKPRQHPSRKAYARGCRCDECKQLKSAEKRRYLDRKKSS